MCTRACVCAKLQSNSYALSQSQSQFLVNTSCILRYTMFEHTAHKINSTSTIILFNFIGFTFVGVSELRMCMCGCVCVCGCWCCIAYLRCLGLVWFDFGLCLADTRPFGEFLGDNFDFDSSVDVKKQKPFHSVSTDAHRNYYILIHWWVYSRKVFSVDSGNHS